MSPHDHSEHVVGCFRCDLSRDEAWGDLNLQLRGCHDLIVRLMCDDKPTTGLTADWQAWFAALPTDERYALEVSMPEWVEFTMEAPNGLR